MKIAVYCITKNEEQFIKRWAKSAQDADYRIVVDTGSTDNTVQAAMAADCRVHVINVAPWRFDDARNASLALIPADVDMCIALDADEVLLPGWREALEKMPPDATRPRYLYTWSWNADGSPGLTYFGDKIHTRQGYRWTHPVHEVITRYADTPEVQWQCEGLKIHHFPDNTKSRSSYLPLLEMSVREDPNDDRNCHYLGREYFGMGMYDKAIPELKRHLRIGNWAPEKAKSMRLLAKMIPAEAEYWLLEAAKIDGGRREVWLDLAMRQYQLGNWEMVLHYAKRCLEITERDNLYLNEPEPWGPAPYDLLALAYFYLGHRDAALEYGIHACTMDPHDERLAANLKWYQGVDSVEEVPDGDQG